MDTIVIPLDDFAIGYILAAPLPNPLVVDSDGIVMDLFPSGFELTESAIRFATNAVGLETALVHRMSNLA